jgi:hypothetical protein
MRKCLGLLAVLLLAGPALADPPPVQRGDVQRRAEGEFDKADANHDGILTRDEYHAALARIVKAKGGTPTAAGWAKVDAQFDAVDQAHTDRIPRGNFVAAALAHFDGADLNHDGIVTANEARKAQSIKRKVAKEQDKAAAR